MWMTFTSAFEIIVNACKCHVNALRTIFLNSCKCSWMSCVNVSWFVLNLRVMLLDLPVGCHVHRKKRFIMNDSRNPFQQELSYMYNFWGYWRRPHEHCFLAGLLGSVCGGRVILGAHWQFGRLIGHRTCWRALISWAQCM
jgi:hypothetical protein